MRRSGVRLRMEGAVRATAVLVAVGAGVACGGPPEPCKVAQSAASWGATAHFVTDRWAHDAVSRKFTVVTLDRAGAELQTIALQVAQLPDTAPGRAPLIAMLKELRGAVAAADSAAAHDDRASAERTAPQLASATAQMDSLGAGLEQKQTQEQRK